MEECENNTLLHEIENDFQNVIKELVCDRTLERFRQEYERLYNALLKSHSNEQLLIKKCKQLRSELVENAGTVSKAMRMTEDDQNSIILLKKEIEKAWKRVDGAIEKETKAQVTIQQLRSELKTLQKVVQKGCGLSEGQESTVNELLKVKKVLMKEIETQAKDLKKSNQDFNDLFVELESLKRANSESDSLISSLKTKIKEDQETTRMHERREEGLENQLQMLKDRAGTKDNELKNMDDLVETLRNDRSLLQTNISKIKHEYSVLGSEKNATENSLQQLQGEHKKGRKEKDRLVGEKEVLRSEIVATNDRIKKLSNECTQWSKKVEKLKSEQAEMKQHNCDKVLALQEMTKLFKGVKFELEAFYAKKDSDAKISNELRIELRKLSSQLTLTKKKYQKNEQKIEEGLERDKQFKMEADNRNNQIKSMKKKQAILEKQKLRSLQDTTMISNTNSDLKKHIELLQGDIGESKLDITDERKKLKQQQTLYETVRDERNHFCQLSIESGDEIVKLKKEIDILTSQIKQMREDIKTKDSQIGKQEMETKRLQDERISLLKKISKKDEILTQCDKLLTAQDVELNTLRKALKEGEMYQKKQKQIFDNIVNEREFLTVQIIRRNDELALIQEKVRILESTLRKGESFYNERLDDVKTFKLKVNDLQRQLKIRNSEVENMKSLKIDLYNVQKELLHERTKVKALSQELQNPINIHRWRKLEGSDPDSYELIQKIQTLQKRLIEKTEDVVEKDLIIEEKERLYTELKNILARQPGPEVSEQLTAYQQTLKERTKQMKACAAELNMCHAQISEYQYEIEKLNRELTETKRKYFEQKRKEQLLRETNRGKNISDEFLMPLTAPAGPIIDDFGSSGSQERKIQTFMGGGFAIK